MQFCKFIGACFFMRDRNIIRTSFCRAQLIRKTKCLHAFVTFVSLLVSCSSTVSAVEWGLPSEQVVWDHPLQLSSCTDAYSALIRFDSYTGCCLGEASHPGPDFMCSTFAVANPTSIVSKVATYQEIASTCGVDAFFAAETAATSRGQRIFQQGLRKDGFKCHWSTPVPERLRQDGLPSLKGKALGVAMISKHPSRKLFGTLSEDVQMQSRLGHFLLDLGGMQIQCVVMYGLTSAQPDCVARTQALFHAAFQAVDQIALPYIIAGDFIQFEPIQVTFC